jgi:hypothetical protein
MIKLKNVNQVKIDDSFVTLVKKFMQQKVKHLTPRQKHAIDVLSFYLTDPGFEKFITRLKQMPYESFSAIRSNDNTYFKAVTRDIVLNYQGRSDRDSSRGKIDIGSYTIYVPFDSILHSNVNNIHFIPARDPIAPRDERCTHIRHMHHLADYIKEEHKYNNPLSYRPRTCWGSFSSMIPAIASDGDLVELYRVLYLFTSIWNARSPLADLGQLRRIYQRVE